LSALTPGVDSVTSELTTDRSAFQRQLLGAFVRRDQYNYHPSRNRAEKTPDLQQETVTQNRPLTNAGLRKRLAVKGIHNVKAGVTFEHTFLTEKS
jgi:hypothetical protein